VSETWHAFATGSVLTAWALFLRTDPSTIAVLQGLATGAQILHGPAGFLTEWVGRKRLAVAALASARLVWTPMALLPLCTFDTETATALLITVAALSAALQVIGQNAWNAWIGDLVPPPLRGRYFGARTTFVTGGVALASLACAMLLESGLPRAVTLPAIAGLLAATGLVSAGLLARQIEPPRTEDRPQLRAYLAALRDPRARGLLVYNLAWGSAVAPGAAFFSLHVLGALHASFFVLAAHAMVVALARMLTAPFWGRAVDRWGARPVLFQCSLGIALMPALWVITTPGCLWPLAIDAALSGVMWGGHGVASFDLPLGIAPASKRSYYLALFAMASGIGFAVSAAVSGWAADALAVAAGGDLRPLFVVSALARAACALIALRVHDPDALGVRALIARLPQNAPRNAG
jgi:MFS family permease